MRVTGERLYTEMTGSGPALVLIPGGGGDAEMYAGDYEPDFAALASTGVRWWPATGRDSVGALPPARPRTR